MGLPTLRFLLSWSCLLSALRPMLAQTALQNTAEYAIDTYVKMVQMTCAAAGTGNYFDTALQKCAYCSASIFFIADYSKLDAIGDPIGCKCMDGYYKDFNDCSTGTHTTDGQCVGYTCVACSANQMVLRDQSKCASCVNGISYGTIVASTGPNTCACTDKSTDRLQYLVEVSTVANTGTPEVHCEICPMSYDDSLTAKQRSRVIHGTEGTPVTIAGKVYYPDAYSCQSCPDPHMVMSYSNGVYSCSCDSGYTLTGVEAVGPQSCVLTTTAASYLSIEASAAVAKYQSGATLASQTLLHYFTKSAANCMYYGSAQNVLDCQALANLCVLQLYDTATGACKAFRDIVTARGTTYTNNIINWGTGMPWLYISGGCSDEQFNPKMSLPNYVLKYVVASYTLNGTYVGMQEMGTLLQYCKRRPPYSGQGGGTSSSTFWQIFGSTEITSYTCDLDTLKTQEHLFHELYLYDYRSAKYYPVAVRIVKAGGNKVNNLNPRSQCDSGDMLVRRFFMFDMVSGLTSSSTAGNPAVMRYASDIYLEVQISTSSFRQIKTPVLTIQYAEGSPATWKQYDPTSMDHPVTLGSQLIKYNFQARYTMNMDNFQTNLFGFFVAVIVFCGLTFLFRLNNWNVRQSRLMQAGLVYTGLNTKIFFEFVLLAASSWVYFFFPVHLIICWYFFVFFKLQSVPATLLPAMNSIYVEGSPYFVFVANLHIMAFFQLFYCLVFIYRQSFVDIFFLDWQPPSAPKIGAKGQVQQPGQVSAWRTLFVANEWSELMTTRKTDVAFSLFWIGFFLLGLGQEFTATQQPDVTNLQRGTLNVVLRFANVTWWWCVMSLFQYLWKFLFWERFITESPEQQFIDFCTIAKVSILVLDEQYHGYYLHCRSPHQNADSSMAELVEMLHREEAGLTVDRSLEGGPKDVQTFRVFMSGEWRARFDKIYNQLVKPDGAMNILSRGRIAMGRSRGAGSLARMGGGTKDSSNIQDTKSLTTAWMRVGNFLQEFVENSLNTPGLRRVIREGTYFERFAGTAPEMSSADQPCVFLPDRNFEYASVLFYGREIDLLLMNVLAYCLFDLWFGNTAISILLTYLLDFAFVQLRQRLGLANIANKTLIDSRFLI